MKKTYKASINMWELSTDAAHILHKKGSEDYPEIRKAMVKADYADSYEEVAVEDIPPYTKAEYAEEVSRLIRERYSLDAELAILRQRDSKPQEFAAYNAYAEQCKSSARQMLDDEC